MNMFDFLIYSQMIAYQKTIHTMEMSAKQQQEFTNRTVRDLKEQISRITREKSQQEELSQAVRNERDRLVRDQQAKVDLCVNEIDFLTLA